MSHEITTALAVPFSWTPGAYDLRMAFGSGASPVDVTLDAGLYRVHLAGTMAAPRDALRRLEARANAALAAAGRSETIAVEITARGRITITLSTGVATWTVTSALRDLLGLPSTSAVNVAALAGVQGPQHFYLLLGGAREGWKPAEAIAASLTNGGRALAIRSGTRTWEDELTAEFIPSDPDHAVEQEADWTPWEPGATATAAPTFHTLLDEGLARQIAHTSQWQRVRASTTEPFDLVVIDPADLARPRSRYQFTGLTAWRQWSLRMIRSGTKTRA